MVAALALSVNAADKTVAADCGDISFTGRVQHLSGGAVRYDWVGTYFQTEFSGRRIAAVLSEEGTSYHNVFIDGNFVAKIKVSGAEPTTYTLADNLAKGKHILRFQKCTEGEFGCTTLHGLVLESGASLGKVSPRKRFIEVIGDSYTCGYGTESKSANERFALETENCDKAYGCIIARYFDADYALVAHSGQGIVRHYGDSVQVSANNMPNRWMHVFDAHGKEKYDFKAYRPDIVIIQLGENDFSPTAIPAEEHYVGNYIRLIENVKEKYGDVPVLCVTPFAANIYLKAAIASLRDRTLGMSRVYMAHSLGNLVSRDNDMGADGHPNYQGQCKIAMSLIPQISFIMNWNLKELF